MDSILLSRDTENGEKLIDDEKWDITMLPMSPSAHTPGIKYLV